MEKIVGILGGMGPDAGCEFMRRLIRRTPADKDQDHLQAILYNQPKIPDRSRHILQGAPSPLSALVEAVGKLQSWGADFIVIPCNTAHHYYQSLAAAVRIPILDIIEITARDASEVASKGGQVGVMATGATISAGLFQSALTNRGLRPLVPHHGEQRELHAAIETIKTGRDLDRAAVAIERIGSGLIQKRADLLIFGCTELGLVLDAKEMAVPIVDSLDALARSTIEYATIPVHEPSR